jgi:hypothetical protein
MTIDILGTGESLLEYPAYTGNKKIGVNNITAYRDVDYLVIVDKPEVFREKGTFDDVIAHNPKPVYTNLHEEWSGIFNYINRISLANIKGNIDFSDGKIPWSSNSTFVAACIAFIGYFPSEIHLYGVDLNTHPAFGKSDPLRHGKALEHFRKLNDYFRKSGTIMKTTQTSALSAFLPVMNH